MATCRCVGNGEGADARAGERDPALAGVLLRQLDGLGPDGEVPLAETIEAGRPDPAPRRSPMVS